MVHAFLQSSQDFVRALKAQQDPPQPGSPTKIEIAEQAWANSAFYVPSKGEVIADWILTKLLKEKDRETALNSLFNERYWRLLLLVLEPNDSNSKTDSRRATSSWLTQLLHRIPLSPVVVAFLSKLRSAPTTDSLVAHFASCVSVLWPFSSQRMNAEALQDGFGAILCCISYSGLQKTTVLIANSYRNSFSNSSNKKKLHQSFLQNHLSTWLRSLSAAIAEDLRETILTTGMDTLLNLEVLRQNQDTKTDLAIVSHLQVLADQNVAFVYEFIPTLLSHYVQALTRHRGALFSQGSQGHTRAPLSKLKQAATTFFSSLIELVGDDESVVAWNARLALLKIVERDNIFNEDKGSSSVTTTTRVLHLCVRALEGGWKAEECTERTTIVIQCLSTATRIDYDLISPILHQLLPRLLQIPTSDHTHLDFLELLLSYHTKTRTIHDHITALFTSISDCTTTSLSFQGTPQDFYQLVSSSSLMHSAFLINLAKAIRNFMTESQCLPMIQHVLEVSKNAYNRFHDTRSSSSKSTEKKRMLDPAMGMDVDTVSKPSTSSEDASRDAVSYTCIARLTAVVLSSLPTQSISAETLQSLRTAIIEFRKEFVLHAVSKTLKALKKRDGDDLEAWDFEVTVAVNLRLLYALDVSQNLMLPVEVDEKLQARFIGLLERKDEVLPELVLEVFRALFYQTSVTTVESQDRVNDHLIAYLNTHLSTLGRRRSGSNHLLIKDAGGRSSAAFAVTFMITERWLPELDRSASKDQLSRFLKLLTNIELSSSPGHAGTETGLQPQSLLCQVLHSAQFWEYRNIRDALLEHISSTTSALVPDVSLPSNSSHKSHKPTTPMFETTSIFCLLLFFPLEYFTWPLLQELTKRAVVADKALATTTASRGILHQIVERLVSLRAFLKRAYGYATSGGLELGKENEDELVLHLLRDMHGLETVPDMLREAFEKATLDLVDTHLTRLLKLSKKNGPDTMLNVLRSFGKETFKSASHSPVISLYFGRLVDILIRDFSTPGSVHEDVVEHLSELHRMIVALLQPEVGKIANINFGKEDLGSCIGVLSRVYDLLRLTGWLNANNFSTKRTILIASTLTQKIIPALKDSPLSDSDLCELSVLSFAILLQELEYGAGLERAHHLDLVVGIYIYIAGTLPEESLQQVDKYLSVATKKLVVADYEHLLSFVGQSLSEGSGQPSVQIKHLIHLAALLLREHPSHSLVYIQKFATKCLGIFVDNTDFVEGEIDVRLKVLQLVVQYCSDQQAALRIQDTSLVFLLLSKYLAPTLTLKHDPTTSTSLFHGLISILTTLIRLRRDLVTLCLPHLGMILQRLICCTKGCRPNLGRKQTSLVMGTLPKWISPTRPLGVTEAKALARLLESLTVKTTIRTISSSSGQSEHQQKAESLSKPFSKHAGYILKAYVETMNDALCILPLDIRKELKPGLFALCGMMNEHSRDSLMVTGGFGDGGKAILKAVWQDWEASRYTGKG